jgi:anti-sigma regulatory factor (Ser/Thr protein kinase)
MAHTVTAIRLMSSTHDPDSATPCLIRRRVRGLLVDRGVGAAIIDDALLVVEELVANVLDHAHTRFGLELRLTGTALHIAVRDRSGRSPQIRRVDPYAVRGRGLQLVASLSQRWGCEHHADGKTVWAELSLDEC